MNDWKHEANQVQREMKLLALTGNRQDYENTLGRSNHKHKYHPTVLLYGFSNHILRNPSSLHVCYIPNLLLP